MDRIVAATANAKLVGLSAHEFVECAIPPDQRISLSDIPLKPMLTEDPLPTTHCTHALDIITGLTNKPNLPDLLAKMNTAAELPEPFGLKSPPPPCVKQYLTFRDDNGWVLVKHYYFGSRRAHILQLNESFYGKGFVVDIDGFKSRQKLALHLQQALLSLGGELVIKNTVVQADMPDKKLLSAEEIHAGFEFMAEHAPLGNADNQCLQWVLFLDYITTKLQTRPRDGDAIVVYVEL